MRGHIKEEHVCGQCGVIGQHRAKKCPQSKFCVICEKNTHKTLEHVCSRCGEKGTHRANECEKVQWQKNNFNFFM